MLYLIPMLEPSVLSMCMYICLCVCFSCIRFAHSCCFEHGYL